MSALIEVGIPGLCALIFLSAVYIGIVWYEADQRLGLRKEPPRVLDLRFWRRGR